MINPLLGTFLASVAYFFIHYTISLFRFWRWKPAADSDESDGLSVIVCAHNEHENLQNLIPLLLAQQYDKKEIIIVDDRSFDDSYDYLLSLKPKIKLVRVDHVPDHANGKKYGITLGVKAATYDRLVFTDADCWPETEQWLNQVNRQFDQEAGFVIGFSQYEKLGGLLNLFIRFETMMTALLYLPRALANNPYMGVGRNLAYRKSMFMKHNGFGHMLNIVGGDDDLLVNKYARKSRTRVLLEKESLIISKPKTSWSKYMTQKKRHLSVGKHYRSTDKIRLGFHTLVQITFWLTFAILAALGASWQFLLGGFLVKFIWQGWLMLYAAHRTGDKFDFWLLPLLDFFYSVYVVIVGTVASFSKKVVWS